jgi:hypothetical protein
MNSLLHPLRSIRRGRKRPFLIVFGSDRITAVFHRIVNERKRSDTPFSGRLRQLLTVCDATKNGRNHCPGLIFRCRVKITKSTREREKQKEK